MNNPPSSPVNGDNDFSESEARRASLVGLKSEINSFNLAHMWTTFVKWWWLIGIVVAVIMALTVLFVSRQTPYYSAHVTLEVKQQERNITGIASVEDINANKEFLNTQIELLKSANLAESVINTLNLLSDPDFVGEESESMSRDDRLSLALSSFSQKLRVSPVGRSRLIRLRFEHSDSNKAALITNTVSENFISGALEREYNSTAYARNFLQDRLATVKLSLEKAERELVGYASENDILIIDNNEDGNVFSSLNKSALVTLDKQLTEARTERMKLEQSYNNALQEQFSLELLNNESLNKLIQDRVNLNTEYSEKSIVFKPGHPDMLELESRIEFFDNVIATEKKKIIDANRTSIEADFKASQALENDLNRRVSSLKGEVSDLHERGIEYTILKRQVDTERAQYQALLQRLKEVSVSEGMSSNLVEIVDLAKPARFPFKPNKPRILIVIFLISSGLVFGLASLYELLDDRMKTPEDIKEKLNQTLMGVIPVVSDPKGISTLMSDPTQSISEAYSTLRANLQYSGVDGGPQVVQLTSTRPAEGKSVSALGLALRYASLGEKTLLIDADMRQPTFIMDDSETASGLSYLLTSRDKLNDHVLGTTHDNLYIITSGQNIPNPTDALSSTRFKDVLAEARNEFTYIVVDSPPVMGLADAPIIGATVDATLMVVEANSIRTNNIKTAMGRLEMSGTRILGILLTKYKASNTSYTDYKYDYSDKAKNFSSNGSKQKLDLT